MESEPITDLMDLDFDMGVGRDYMKMSTPTTKSYAVLDGLYHLHDELGSGGFGKVFFHFL